MKLSITVSDAAVRRLRREKGVISVNDPDAAAVNPDEIRGAIVSFEADEHDQANALVQRLRDESGFEGAANDPVAYPDGGSFIFVSKRPSQTIKTAAEADLAVFGS